jgi:hypothetical protein
LPANRQTASAIAKAKIGIERMPASTRPYGAEFHWILSHPAHIFVTPADAGAKITAGGHENPVSGGREGPREYGRRAWRPLRQQGGENERGDPTID